MTATSTGTTPDLADRLRDRTALVTGGGRGIGLETARRLARDGARVSIVDVDLDVARAAAEGLRDAGADVRAVGCDVTREDQVTAAVAATIETFGRIDVLMNNAGITGPAKPMVEYSLAEWTSVLTTDLTSAFLMCRAVIPHMLERGTGRVVNIASISGKEGNPNMVAYSTAKAALIGLTKALAKEVATQGIAVNCVTPAVIETGMLGQVTTEAVDYMVSRIPMGRMGRPGEVAALVAWLSSDECSFSTGAVFDISGGRATY